MSTLWHRNGTDKSDNLNAILTQGDISGDPAFTSAAGDDCHIQEHVSRGQTRGVDAGLQTDMDGKRDLTAWDTTSARTNTPATGCSPTCRWCCGTDRNFLDLTWLHFMHRRCTRPCTPCTAGR